MRWPGVRLAVRSLLVAVALIGSNLAAVVAAWRYYPVETTPVGGEDYGSGAKWLLSDGSIHVHQRLDQRTGPRPMVRILYRRLPPTAIQIWSPVLAAAAITILVISVPIGFPARRRDSSHTRETGSRTGRVRAVFRWVIIGLALITLNLAGAAYRPPAYPNDQEVWKKLTSVLDIIIDDKGDVYDMALPGKFRFPPLLRRDGALLAPADAVPASPRRRGWREFDLRLMSWKDGSGLPNSGKDLVVVGTDYDDRLLIRIFDQEGHRITDTDETKLPPAQAQLISTLKQQLQGWLRSHVMTDVDEWRILGLVASIVGQTLWGRPGAIYSGPIRTIHFKEDGSILGYEGFPLEQASHPRGLTPPQRLPWQLWFPVPFEWDPGPMASPPYVIRRPLRSPLTMWSPLIGSVSITLGVLAVLWQQARSRRADPAPISRRIDRPTAAVESR